MRNLITIIAIALSTFSFANITPSNELITNDVTIETVDITQDLSDAGLYLQGREDGKEFAKNKGGNFVVGFLTGGIGVLITAATSNQKPSFEAMTFRGEDVIKNVNYRRGYKKGAKSNAVSNSLIGWGTWVVLLLL